MKNIANNTTGAYNVYGVVILDKEQVVNLLDPKNILKRGYAIPLFNGKIIDQNQLPEINDEIELITYSHVIKTKITKIDKNEE